MRDHVSNWHNVTFLLYSYSTRHITWKVYVTDWTNWLENIAILLTLLIIPFRIADLYVQWVFVALAYILHSLRIFKYAVIKS